jgi:hypothetical protein
MAVAVKIFQPDKVKMEKLDAAKAAVQRVANEYRAEAEVTSRDDAGLPIARLTAAPQRRIFGRHIG